MCFILLSIIVIISYSLKKSIANRGNNKWLFEYASEKQYHPMTSIALKFTLEYIVSRIQKKIQSRININ